MNSSSCGRYLLPSPPRVLTCELLRHPQPASSFQNPGLVAVHQEEGVVVAEGCRILSALAPLAVLLQQAGDHGQRCPGTVTALQPQSDDHKSYRVTSKSEVWVPSLPSISHVVTSKVAN